MDQSVSRIVIRRHPYEEPYHVQLEWFVSNGSFFGTKTIFCNVNVIREIGDALSRFPVKVGDEYLYEYGSEHPKPGSYFSLRACTTDAAGHCALQFSISNKNDISEDGKCIFSIIADAGSFQRLGKMLVRFADLQHLQLVWTPREGRLDDSVESFTDITDSKDNQ